jgi:hypothetical protein
MFRDLIVFFTGVFVASYFDTVKKNVEHVFRVLDLVDIDWIIETSGWSKESKQAVLVAHRYVDRAVQNRSAPKPSASPSNDKNDKNEKKKKTLGDCFEDRIPSSSGVEAYEPKRKSSSSYEDDLVARMNGFMSTVALSRNSVVEFVRLFPPPMGAVPMDTSDILMWIDLVESYADPDCKTYAKVVRTLYDQVCIMFHPEPCRVETEAIQKVVM